MASLRGGWRTAPPAPSSKLEGGRWKQKKKGQKKMQEQIENLKVWQKSMDLVKELYKASQKFPKEEQCGLTGQLRRAGVSIPVNIAEGKGRYHKKEYIQFLYMARGSIYELMTLIRLAEELNYLQKFQSTKLLENSGEITAMLNGLIQSLQ